MKLMLMMLMLLLKRCRGRRMLVQCSLAEHGRPMAVTSHRSVIRRGPAGPTALLGWGDLAHLS